MHQNLVKMAQDEGFGAAVLSTSDLCFDFSFRDYCEENLCGNFGANEFCPPHCGTPQEMKASVLKYKTILVLKSEHIVLDFSDVENIKAAQKEHNEKTLRVINNMQSIEREVALCSPSDLEFPSEISAHCLSAYCIDVKKMAEKCKMEYDFKDSKLSFFGFIILD